MTTWKEYQEEVAAYFRSLGLDASTDVSVDGVRTKHIIDVVVRSHHAGFDITWVVECKHWKRWVSKLHVVALRGIVTDIGADRGILLSETGFQSGAIEAANLTNVQVTSISELRKTAEDSIRSMRFRDLYDRLGICAGRYWSITKDDRIKAGLRPEVGDYGYSSAGSIHLCQELLTRAFRGAYPFQLDDLRGIVAFGIDYQFETAKEVERTLDEMITELERKLDEYHDSTGHA